ncbi:MAG: hypothetical protein K2W91_09935 [Novosphingobium sp.]|nr:hypothetical protein [Novosphingobium sp.]
MRPIHAALASLALGLATAAPAQAQQTSEPKVNLVIVFGEDKCPESDAGTITVCARKDEGERYRIPEPLRENLSPQNEAWNQKVRAYETLTKTGTQSCSPVGAGGWTGCSSKLINEAYAQKKTDPGIRAAQLIAEERARRLANIDSDAAETQAAVERQEEQIIARRKLEQQASGEAPEPETPPPTPPK